MAKKTSEKQEKKSTKKVDESLNEEVVAIDTTVDNTEETNPAETTEEQTEITEQVPEQVNLEAPDEQTGVNLESVSTEEAGEDLEKPIETVNGDPAVISPEGEAEAVNEELTAEREIGYQNGGPGTIVEGAPGMGMGFGPEVQLNGLNSNPAELMNREQFDRDIEPVRFDEFRQTPHYTPTNAKDCRVWDDATPEYVAQCPPKKETTNPGAYVAQRPY